MRTLGIVVIVIAVVAGIFYHSTESAGAQAGRYRFAVGRPGPGAVSPSFRLPSTDGHSLDLMAFRGGTVLLYFMEGVTCPACWNQLKDIDAHMADIRKAGIDQVVTITSDPVDQLRQRAQDEGISSPILSDGHLAVSHAYTANRYGMMGLSRDGHTFVLVGPTGRILWRADYGGYPDYTMFVPVPNLLADIHRGLGR